MLAMGAPDTVELVGELYLVPPTGFVAIRDELVRKARRAGYGTLARELQGLRRPVQSAWVVNLLARHERAAMEELSALGRQLRDAQKRLDGSELRRLGAQRQRVVADLLARARRRAAEAGARPADRVLCEVEATLNAALVDLAASSAVLSGRLVRPMSHHGFGPKPQLPADGSPGDLDAVPQLAVVPTSRLPVGTGPEDEWVFWPVAAAEHDAGAPGLPLPAGPPEELDGQRPRRLRLVRNEPQPPAGTQPPAAREGPLDPVADELAAAESAHWRHEHELAAAEAAVVVAREELEWFEQQRTAARQEKLAAERRLAEARSAQHASVRAVVEARRALEAAEARRRSAAEQPPSGSGQE